MSGFTIALANDWDFEAARHLQLYKRFLQLYNRSNSQESSVMSMNNLFETGEGAGSNYSGISRLWDGPQIADLKSVFKTAFCAITTLEGYMICSVHSLETHLYEQMVQDMCANVVMNLVEDAKISVYGWQSSPQIWPFLQHKIFEPLCCVLHLISYHIISTHFLQDLMRLFLII